MPRLRRCLVALPLALLAALAFAAPAQAISISPPEPHSPNAEDIATSYWVMLAATVALLVIFHAALLVAVLRFRARRGRRPRRFAAARGAFRPPVGLLSLVAIALFVFGIVITSEVRELEPSGPGGLDAAQTAQVGVKGAEALAALEAGEAPTDEGEAAGTLEINAIAQQWLWRFEYPEHTPQDPRFSYGELVVPVDTTVVLNIDSTDVMHTWWVPALGGQVQAAPGKITQTWFKADEEGRYPGRSTIFSGTAYAAMRAWVRVVSVPDYEAYVEGLGEDLAEAQDIVAREEQGVEGAEGSP